MGSLPEAGSLRIWQRVPCPFSAFSFGLDNGIESTSAKFLMTWNWVVRCTSAPAGQEMSWVTLSLTKKNNAYCIPYLSNLRGCILQSTAVSVNFSIRVCSRNCYHEIWRFSPLPQSLSSLVLEFSRSWVLRPPLITECNCWGRGGRCEAPWSKQLGGGFGLQNPFVLSLFLLTLWGKREFLQSQQFGCCVAFFFLFSLSMCGQERGLACHFAFVSLMVWPSMESAILGNGLLNHFVLFCSC